jgi:hypothetical protein
MTWWANSKLRSVPGARFRCPGECAVISRRCALPMATTLRLAGACVSALSKPIAAEAAHHHYHWFSQGSLSSSVGPSAAFVAISDLRQNLRALESRHLLPKLARGWQPQMPFRIAYWHSASIVIHDRQTPSGEDDFRKSKRLAVATSPGQAFPCFPAEDWL